jgi:hypothetical protein
MTDAEVTGAEAQALKRHLLRHGRFVFSAFQILARLFRDQTNSEPDFLMT